LKTGWKTTSTVSRRAIARHGRPGAAARVSPRYTPEIADKIVGEVTSGKTLTDVCREPGMPSITTIKHWVADNRADFTARYRQAQEIGRALSGGPASLLRRNSPTGFSAN